MIESVLNRRAAKLGTARIRQELQGKGLDPQAVSAALTSWQTRERARALDVWRKKFGAPPQNAQAAAKQMRFLAARGFGAEIIRRVVSNRDED